MPRKDRPNPLSDNIFRTKLGQPLHDVPGVPEEEAIPVHNTFIQFRAPGGAEPGKKHLSTAPAWIGPSFQSMMQSAMQEVDHQPSEPVHADGGPSSEWSTLGSPKKLASPKKVPVMRYSLSGSSARAAGIHAGSSAVIAGYGHEGGGWEGVGGGSTQAGEENAEDEDEEDEDDESGNERPRRQPVPAGPLPSMGSVKHEEGLCKRCCFFPKGRCQNGNDCEFCHYDHEKRKRKKKKKGAKQKDSDGEGGEAEADSSTRPAAGGHSTAPVFSAYAGHQGLALATPPSDAVFGMPFDPAIWGAPSAEDQSHVGPLRGASGPPLTAPPPLPPRGLPLPDQPPPPAPFLGQLGQQAPALTADPYYAGLGGYSAAPGGYTPGAPPGVQDAYGMSAYGARGYGEFPNYAGYAAATGMPGYTAAGFHQANGTGLPHAQAYGRGPGGAGLPPPR